MATVNQLGEFIIRDILEKKGITQAELGDALQVSRQTINGLISGKKNLSEKVALRLARFTNRTPKFFLEMAKQNKQWQALLKTWNQYGGHILVDHELLAAHELGFLGINHFCKKSVQPASYDLRIAEAIVSNKGEQDSRDLKTCGHLVLPVGARAVVQTIEEFDFPIYMVGRLGGMANLADDGILNLLGHQVDPGYKGTIQAVLINMGTKDFLLEYGLKFISLEISYLPVEPNHPWPGERRVDYSEDAKEFVNPDQYGDNSQAIHNALQVIKKALTQNDSE